ncbi:hypothetical protein [Cupriavidus sp. AU9028]|uniref:hypothetical protein n=1 Tax=Cupriavidus sp. AU9028 TaxID=2871157 RepID=UPI001C95D2FE|nr:hypothetical protein [Cupriavidus sp. AU9028]MBY4897506.1 hypothetical protein [Cupriavidus sp. AU9028]
MPEQLTKHPDVTLQVLRSAGARCGTGDAPQILTRCPAERFCQLPGGEICVYGIDDAAGMTQFARTDWEALGTVVGTAGYAAQGAADAGPAWSAWAPWIGPAVALVAGLLIGALLTRWARRRR